MDQSSALGNIFSAIRSFPQVQDKPVKQALYNAVALFFLFLCCAAGYSVYWILQPFVKPLLWALLVGSALHPLKRSLRDRFKAWFQTLEVTNTPVVFAVILIPVNIINDVSEFVGEIVWQRLRIIITIAVTIPIVLLIYNYTPRIIVMLLWQSVFYGFSALTFFLDKSSFWLLSIILLGYISMVFLLWKPENNTKFHYASTLIWLLCSSCLAKQFGYYQVPMLIVLQMIFFGGFLSEVYEFYNNTKNTDQPISLMESMSLVFNKHQLEIDEENKVDNETIKDSKENVEIIGDRVDNKELTEDKPQKKAEKDPLALDLFEEIPPVTTIYQRKQPTSRPRVPLQRSRTQISFSPRLPKDIVSLMTRRNISTKSSNSRLVDTTTLESKVFLYSVMWACFLMMFWKNVMLIGLLPVPILYYLIKHLGYYIGLWNYLHIKGCDICEIVTQWSYERHDALVPVPIRGLYHIIHKGNMLLKSAVNNSMDTVASFVVMFGLIVFVTCGSVYMSIQIYADAIMMLQMTGSVINQTVVQNPELKQLLPPAWDDAINSILDNAYLYGREGIQKVVRGMMTDVDKSKSENLERQILELWDRVYQNWMSTNDSHGPKVTEDAVRATWDNFITDLQKSPEMFNLSGLMEIGRQNIGTLMTVLESVWSILKGNLSLILSSFSTFVSVVLGGGTAVLNFIVNVVVFLTTLFYLLNCSGELYKPVELLTNFSPIGKRIGQALEAAAIGVFSASFKMAAFYGMWTWFIHNLFGARIVYIPAAYATIFGAIPFLGTYWACLPAVLDLWLAQDRGISAIILAVAQFLPTSVVDTTIYNEIKGGAHPYLTGLAIGGGIFSMGIEGAIMGPMLLCGLFVAIDLSSSLFKETPSEESLSLTL